MPLHYTIEYPVSTLPLASKFRFCCLLMLTQKMDTIPGRKKLLGFLFESNMLRSNQGCPLKTSGVLGV